MKTIEHLTSQTLATLAPMANPASKENGSPIPSPERPKNVPEVRNPCRSAWQRKWLRLDVTHPDVQTMADEAERFCSRWFKNCPAPSLLVLAGSYGRGKSHVARCIYQFAQRAGWSSFHETKRWGTSIPSAMYLRWPEVADAFKEGQYGVLEDCFTQSLLILDPSKNAADKLCQILTRRERLFTVVTTNISPALWPERFDGRIGDRLLRNSVAVELVGTISYSEQ
jgi:DNA replication protein DnaC